MPIFTLFSDKKFVSGIKEQYTEASRNYTNIVSNFQVCNIYYTICACVWIVWILY